MQLSRYIDHTFLKPDANQAQIEKLCKESIEHQFFSVCVNSSYVSLCAEILKGSDVSVCSVIGFPLGACDTETKSFETTQAIKNGASEIDMVIHIGKLKDKKYDEVEADIRAVVLAARGKKVKVIIETALLTEEEKIAACKASLNANAHFVKTCTGFSGGGATVEDIALMKSVVGDKMEIKASGGIKDTATAKALLEAGATRLGTSSGVALVQGFASQGGY